MSVSTQDLLTSCSAGRFGLANLAASSTIDLPEHEVFGDAEASLGVVKDLFRLLIPADVPAALWPEVLAYLHAEGVLNGALLLLVRGHKDVHEILVHDDGRNSHRHCAQEST